MKIVLVGPVYPYKGGIAHYTSLLYRALAKEYEIELISYKMQYPKLLFKKEQKDYSSDTFKIDNAEFLINTANPLNIISVAKRINKNHPDAVLIQWWHPYFAPCYRILTSQLKKDIKVLFTCHNVFPHERFPFDRLLAKTVLKKGNGFIVHSEEDKNDLMSIVDGASIRLTPHPSYDVFKLRGIRKNEARVEICEKDGFLLSTDEKIMLFFGFVREYKGLKHLLRAMQDINARVSNSRLLVVGSFGDDKQQYIDLIDELGINEYVYLKDSYTPDNEVEKYFSAADIVVLPYESATQSGIVQIAYGFEKPVVVTNVGGLPEVVDDRKTGYVIQPFSSQQISEVICDYFEHDRYDDFNKWIKKEQYRFSWEKMVEEIKSLVEKDAKE